MVVQNANNKQLIWMIFIVLEKDDTIRRGIWPQKGDSMSGKSKSTHYKNLAQKVLISESEFQPLVMKNDGKAAIHFGTSVKNQMAQLEKGFKEAWKNLGTTGGGFPNEDAIWPEGEVRDKWEQVKITCPQYFRMKALVEDRFDNIRPAITNSGEGINLDLMDESRKRTYRETIRGDDDVEGDLDDDVMGKLIYVFSQIRYTKTKTYRRYIYIRQ